MFSWEFCDISKNSFFTEHLRTTASDAFQYFATSRSLYNRLRIDYQLQAIKHLQE